MFISVSELLANILNQFGPVGSIFSLWKSVLKIEREQAALNSSCSLSGTMKDCCLMLKQSALTVKHS